MKKTTAGFTLIEVLIFITILSLFFVIAAATVTATLRNIQINEHRIIASRYGEELMEWVRSEKEKDWYLFSSTHALCSSGPCSSYTYCFNDQSNLIWPSTGSCTTNGLVPAIFKREVLLQSADSTMTRIHVTVNVSWDENGITQTIPFQSDMSVYEQ